MQRTIIAAAALAFAFGHSSSAQQPAPAAAPQATGVIAGQLTTDGGQPLRKATLRLTNPAARSSRTTTSDGEGRYAFANVAPGEYTLSASKPGYLDMTYGARRAGAGNAGVPIKLAANQKLEKINLVVPRGSVIVGTVLDEFGDPAFNTPVRAMRVAWQNGGRTLVTGANAVTDDRGMYRLAGLMPGEYLVSATPRDTVATAMASAEALRDRQQQLAATGRTEPLLVAPPPPPSPTGYVSTYYPGTPSAAAAGAVTVGSAQEIPGIDLKLQMIQTVSISGRVTSTENPLPQTRLQLADASMPVNAVGIWWRDMRPDGTFSFHGLVPGSYILSGTGTPGGQPGMAGGDMWGRVDVTADPRNTNPVTLSMQRGVTVSATISADTLPPGFDAAKMRVSLSPVPSPSDWEMPVHPLPRDASGRHSVQNVLPGQFQFRVLGLPDGWVLDSAIFDGKDAADLNLTIDGSRHITGVELKLTPRRAEVGGQLTNASGAPVSDYSVVLFPSERRLWVPQSRRIQVAQPAPDGRFTFQTLPPGDYRIVALADIEPGRQFDPEWLSQIMGGAVAVQLTDGEKRTQDLRIR